VNWIARQRPWCNAGLLDGKTDDLVLAKSSAVNRLVMPWQRTTARLHVRGIEAEIDHVTDLFHEPDLFHERGRVP